MKIINHSKASVLVAATTLLIGLAGCLSQPVATLTSAYYLEEQTRYDNEHLKAEEGYREIFLSFDLSTVSLQTGYLRLCVSTDPGNGRLQLAKSVEGDYQPVSSVSGDFAIGDCVIFDIPASFLNAGANAFSVTHENGNDVWFHSSGDSNLEPLLTFYETVGEDDDNSGDDDHLDDDPNATLIYHEAFSLADAASLFDKGYWFFYDGGSPTQETTALHQRFRIVDDPVSSNSPNKVIRVTKYSGDDDFTGGTLNPRSELRAENPDFKFQQDKEYRVSMKTYFDSDQASTFAAEFMQIMGRKASGGAGPSLQLEVRYGDFRARRPSGHEVIAGNSDFASQTNQWLQWRVDFCLSRSTTKGYFRIYLNGQLVHEIYGANIETNNPGWLQYGVYASNKTRVDMENYIDDVMIKSLSAP